MAIAPPVIITPVVATQKQVKTRARFIGIDNPEVGTVRIDFNVEQKLMLDGRGVAPLPNDDPSSSGISNVRRDFAGAVPAKVVTITDPVTGQDVTISAAGIASALQQIFCDWYAEDLAAKTGG